MTTYISLLIGLTVWIVLWAIGVKAFDALMLLILIVLVGATIQSLGRYLPGNREDRPGRTGL